MQRFPMTTEGAAALRDELQRLKTEDRPRVSKAIAEAREHGDLKENAEYHAAREQQSFIEGRIQELEGTLSQSQVIDPATLPQDGRVVFGVTVTLLNIDNDTEVKYQIVGDYESDIKLNRISVSSPIARALIGKEMDDVVTVQAPGGNIEYEIIEISYED